MPQRRAVGSAGPSFRAAEEGGSERHRAGAERQGGSEAAAVHDPAGGDHGESHGIDDLGHEREGADQRGLRIAIEGAVMAARFRSLGADEVDTGLLQGLRLGDRRGGAHRGDPGLAAGVEHLPGRDAEGEAEYRHALLEQHLR